MVHPTSTLAAVYRNHLFPVLLVIIFISCAPYNHQPAIKPQQRSRLSSNITRMIQQSPTSPTSLDYYTSTNNCKSQPNSVLATNPTKRPSQESSKKRKPISSISTKPCIKEFSEQPTKPHPPPAPNIGSPAVASPIVSTKIASSKRRRLIDSVASVELKPHPKVQLIKNPSLPPRDNINDWFRTLNKSTTQPQPPPAPNFNHSAKARPLAQRPILQSFSQLPNPGHRSTQSPLSTTRSLSQTLPYNEDLMVTCQGTNQSAYTSHMQEKNEAELALQKKMEKECAKHQQEKPQQKEEHRTEEEARKHQEDAKKGGAEQG
jgi:hypothetical protein